MSVRLLALAFAALRLVACSSNDLEDVKLPSQATLVSRYGSLAPGTFRVGNLEGSDFYLSEISKTLYLSKRELGSFNMGISSMAIMAIGYVGEASWSGSLGSAPTGSWSCSGSLYVIESTPTLLRGVFAGACGEVDPLRGPHGFRLFEGGFAYVR